MYAGWIVPTSKETDRQKDEEYLTQLGIELGSWDEDYNEWSDCIIPNEETFKKLDESYLQRFIWGMTPQ